VLDTVQADGKMDEERYSPSLGGLRHGDGACARRV
jgi:hypothetical protein